jgi:hypothetical protein
MKKPMLVPFSFFNTLYLQAQSSLLPLMAGLIMCLVFACQVSSPSVPAVPPVEVHVSLNETLPIAITKDAGATFITFYTEEDYRKIFLDELKKLLATDMISVDNVNPQFAISFAALEMNETTNTDTVKDQKSQDNGKVFYIAEAKLKATGTLLNLSSQQSVNWNVTHDKHERVTSFQNLGQIVKGDNKKMDEYRKKDFDKNEFVSLAGGCGQKAAREINKIIRKQLP